ncbi:MAG: cobyrinate a,c-diamide synthase [Synechococcus sp. Baikal-G1]|nr:MAG: cobyrinate a,c-diamide synthase [Synechococcus sp. Baikal-G1]
MACLIAAPCSGSGKTLVSLVLSALMRQRGQTIQTFKVGPDYLDPQLLARVSGRPCRNLDPLLCGEAWVQRSFLGFGSQADRCLVEGVMGLFDGRGSSAEGSSAAVAQQLDLPIVLVVEASRQAGSLAALVRGFRDHDPGLTIAGVVLNGVGSERHRALLGEALAAIAMPLLGVLPRHASLELPSRHLGLVPPGELADLEQRQGQWASLAERHLDLDLILPLLGPPQAPADGLAPIAWLRQQPQTINPAAAHAPGDLPAPGTAPGKAGAPPPAGPPLPIAIASDQAFHFRYPEAAELLEAEGLVVRYWSPLADEPLPAGCRALVLPGGYPELHGAQLAHSQRSLGELRRAAAWGLPIYAECGGLLLLGQELVDPAGQSHALAGILPFRARRGSLSLGYRQAIAQGDGLVVRRGETWQGHEFHRWQLEPLSQPATALCGSQALWQLDGWGHPARIEGWSTTTLHASWVHLHWAGCSMIPRRLRNAAVQTSAATGTTWSGANPARPPSSSAGA